MPLPPRQQTATGDPSAADLARQIREQVRQQMKDAATDVRHSKQSTPVAPLAPIAPEAPTTPTVPGLMEPDTFDIPPRLEHLGYGFLLMLAVIAVGKPLARALGSVIENRSLRPAQQDFAPRLERIEQGIEAVSIEIERISESQRYLLKMKSPPEPAEIPRSLS